ncbi:kinase-like domain-containing protein [Lentinula raphanica]|nr:kinase-like domain-containing protein [Lentinula raphanica]
MLTANDEDSYSRTFRLQAKWLLYTLLCGVADVLDILLSKMKPSQKPKVSFEPSDIDDLEDDEILELYQDAPEVHPDYSVKRLSPRTVIKASVDVDVDMSDAPDANASDLVFAETDIPVPRIRRVIRGQEDIYFVVQDYIEGSLLADVWSTYSIWRKLGVAFTLRRYVRQLRQLKASPTTPPGPLSAHEPRSCILPPFFGPSRSERGPFASYADFASFFNKWAREAYDMQRYPINHPIRDTRFDDSEALVLTHQDINPRNIIVGTDNRLWLIDWEWSGYYPPWFEYIGMVKQLKIEEEHNSYHEYWNLMIPFVCGPYFEQEKWCSAVEIGLISSV